MTNTRNYPFFYKIVQVVLGRFLGDGCFRKKFILLRSNKSFVLNPFNSQFLTGVKLEFIEMDGQLLYSSVV